MNTWKSITLGIISLLISSCGFADKELDLFNKKGDTGWGWIEFKGQELIIDKYNPKKGEGGKYCTFFGHQNCIIRDTRGWYSVEINTMDDNYEEKLTHFKKHIIAWENGIHPTEHHNRCRNCEYECDNNSHAIEIVKEK